MLMSLNIINCQFNVFLMIDENYVFGIYYMQYIYYNNIV